MGVALEKRKQFVVGILTHFSRTRTRTRTRTLYLIFHPLLVELVAQAASAADVAPTNQLNAVSQYVSYIAQSPLISKIFHIQML
jgi:hypothetical protein